MLSMLKRILQDKHLLQIRLFMWFAKRESERLAANTPKTTIRIMSLWKSKTIMLLRRSFNVEFIQNDGDLNDVTVLISRKGKKWSTLSNLTVEELTHLKNELVEYLKIEKP